MRPTHTAPPSWTLLTRHAHTLIRLHARPRTTLRDLAAYLGVTERSARRIVADLEAEGLLAHRRVGRRNTYQVRLESSLRHPLECGRPAHSIAPHPDLLADEECTEADR